MRLFAVGDIHGCGTAFDAMLAAIDLQANDKVIALGDYINKGPETKLVFDRLLQLSSKGVLVPLLGNHELKMLAAQRLKQPRIDDSVLIDESTLNSYAPSEGQGHLEDIPLEHWRFVEEECLDWFVTENHIFVHATLEADKPLAQQSREALFWKKFNHPKPHCSGKTMVCGHTPQRNGYPINLGHAICLDTAACEGQWLTCLNVTSGQVWQTNQQRQVRRSHIQDYFQADSSNQSQQQHEISLSR